MKSKTPIKKKASLRAIQLHLAKEFSELQRKRNGLYQKIKAEEKNTVYNPNGVEIRNEWFSNVNENVRRLIEMNAELSRLNVIRAELTELAKAK